MKIKNQKNGGNCMNYFMNGLYLAVGWSVGRFIWSAIEDKLRLIKRKVKYACNQEREKQKSILQGENYKRHTIGFVKSEIES